MQMVTINVLVFQSFGCPPLIYTLLHKVGSKKHNNMVIKEASKMSDTCKSITETYFFNKVRVHEFMIDNWLELPYFMVCHTLQMHYILSLYTYSLKNPLHATLLCDMWQCSFGSHYTQLESNINVVDRQTVMGYTKYCKMLFTIMAFHLLLKEYNHSDVCWKLF
jgi:hypothetical protein